MMKLKLSYCVVGLLLSLTCTFSIAAQAGVAEGPAVTKAVAPVYPKIALSANAGGTVAIEVTIDPAGRVVSVRGVEGHKLLLTVAEKAARRWEFVPAPDPTSQKRIAILRFVFRIAQTEKEAETAFQPPYEVVLNYNPPKIVQVTNYNSRRGRGKSK